MLQIMLKIILKLC